MKGKLIITFLCMLRLGIAGVMPLRSQVPPPPNGHPLPPPNPEADVAE